MKKNFLTFETLRTVTALLIAFALAALIILLISKEAATALHLFLTGPLQSFRRFGNVIEMMIPLVFTGLGLSIIFQAGQFNISAAGVFIISAVAAALVAIFVPLPPILGMLLPLFAAVLTGAILTLIPGLLQLKWGTNVLVSSLMLNYIMYNLALYIIDNYAKDSSSGAWMSYKFQVYALLPKLIPRTRIHLGLIIAILAIVLVHVFMYKSKWGYQIRMVGMNSNFSKYSGIPVIWTTLLAQIIGGAIIGLGGGVEMMGMYQRYQWQIMPAYGWDGVTVALIARNKPLYILLSSFFLAYIRIGSDIMSRYTDVPGEVVMIINAIIILMITAERFLSGLQKSYALRHAEIKG